MNNFTYTAWEDGLGELWKNSLPLLIMMVGLPGSGKTTFAKSIPKHFYNSYGIKESEFVILSSDDIRDEMFGCYRKEDNAKVFDELNKRTIKYLLEKKHVIYDATNLSREKRINFWNEINNKLKNINIKISKCVVFMATPYETCLKRNANRKNKVPVEDINRMYKNIDVPDYYENQSVHLFVNYESVEMKPIFSLFTMNSDFMNFKQDNPHHSLTLGEHCMKCGNLLKEENYILREAAYLHDIGKVFTKTFRDSKNNVTDVAHYYGHERVSAYESLFYDVVDKKYLDMSDYIYMIMMRAFLINFHMRLYFMGKSNMMKKYKLGIFPVEQLELLHKADIDAH